MSVKAKTPSARRGGRATPPIVSAREGKTAPPIVSVQREGGHVLEMQRRRLLLAYTEVLAEHGLQGASVDRVCKRAGVSRRTFYDLFIDREACFLAAFELGMERIVAEVVPLYASEGSWRVRVRRALTALLQLFDAESDLARLGVVETLKGGPPVLERRRSLLEVVATAIDQGRAGRSSGPPPLTAEGVVGGVVSVIHTRLISGGTEPLLALANPLMSMIVHPYLGPAAAARELQRAVPAPGPARNGHASVRVQDPFKDLPIRITFRTARVLSVVASQPGASNRAIADAAGIADQGQISKLLKRLADCGLIENHGHGHADGEPNAWTLTERGQAIQHTIEPSEARAI
jgi:AcrR family transcriptional regulator/DNA-binding MarR family transcriptional regulator